MPDSAPISVVIPHYESPVTLGRTVDSILDQTVLPAEIIIVDDASSAAAQRAAEHIASSITSVACRFEVLDVNSGPGAARNAGWDLARQPILAFIDADDSWFPRKIELQSPLLLGSGQLDGVGHPMLVALDSTEPVGSSGYREDVSLQVVHPKQLLWRNRLAMSSVMLRREVPLRFNSEGRYSEDYDLWLRMAFGGYQMAVMDRPLGMHHKAEFGDSGQTSQLVAMERGEIQAYRFLYRSGSISTTTFGAAAAFSLAKYVLRVARVKVRRTPSQQ